MGATGGEKTTTVQGLGRTETSRGQRDVRARWRDRPWQPRKRTREQASTEAQSPAFVSSAVGAHGKRRKE